MPFASRFFACLAAAFLSALTPAVATAHDLLGANLNGIADFSRNHEYVDVMRQSRPFGSAADPFNTVIAVGADGWPAGDFGITLMAAQTGVIGIPGVYKVIFNGQATVSSAASGSVSNMVYTAGTNTTTLDLTFPADGETMALRFQSVPPGNPVKNLRVIRPGFDPANHPVFTPAYLSHVSRFSVLRFMDWLSTNDHANSIVTWADRPTLEKKRTEAEGARWEAIVELANTAQTDIWINIPVRADDEYVTNLATQLRDTLSPTVNVYVEYSNELWNPFFPQFGIQKQLAIDEVTANPNSVLRHDLTNDQNVWAFRRVGKRLKEISDIFKTVWGAGAMNTRVRPVLAGQMANSFIVSEGIDLVDIGMNVRPNTVFYAISGAPYIFPSATNNGNDDEAPGLTAGQLLTAMQSGVTNAPNQDSYQYETHIALGAWYGLKVLAYEGGFDTFGSENVAAKRLANLDPQIRTICQNLLNQWHAFGFDTFLWFNAGANSYNTQFGQWPLLEDMQDTAKPKNQCVDDILAAPLPALAAGLPLTAPIAGGNFIGSANPSGTITNVSGPFGFPGFAQYLLRVDTAGSYKLTFSVTNSATPKVGVQLNGVTLVSALDLPETGGTPVNSQTVTLSLRKGINALRLTRPASAGTWTIQSFTIARAGLPPPDFNADNKPDLIWSNTASGATYIWRMNGLSLQSDSLLATIDPVWKVQGVGDFNSDGHPDVVWRNTLDGNTYVWYLINGVFQSDAFLFSLPPEWVIQGVADFNADGKPDFLMRNVNSGNAFAWSFNNNVAIGDQFLFNIDPAWKVEGVGDFNADGQPDLLFRNMGSGLAFAWNTQFSAGMLSLTTSSPSIFSIDSAWEVVQVADWNADSQPDLLFRNKDTGVVFVWYLNGTTLGASDFIIQIDPSWEIVPRR